MRPDVKHLVVRAVMSIWHATRRVSEARAGLCEQALFLPCIPATRVGMRARPGDDRCEQRTSGAACPRGSRLRHGSSVPTAPPALTTGP